MCESLADYGWLLQNRHSTHNPIKQQLVARQIETKQIVGSSQGGHIRTAMNGY